MAYHKEEKDYYFWHQRKKKISFIQPTHQQPVTVREAIGNLPPIGAGENNAIDRLHITSSLSALNLQRIQHSMPGGSWHDWPDNLVLNCHKKEKRAHIYFCVWTDVLGGCCTNYYNTIYRIWDRKIWASRTGSSINFERRCNNTNISRRLFFFYHQMRKLLLKMYQDRLEMLCHQD